jgi:hypothetical protein
LTKSENHKLLIRDSIARWIDEEDYKIDELNDCISLMYEVDRQCRASFLVELETIIQLQLIMTQLAYT